MQYTYIKGGYFSRKKQKDILLLWGAYDDDEEANSVGRSKILPEPNSWYELAWSRHRSRALARGEILDEDIRFKNHSIDEMNERFYRGEV